MPLVNAHAEGAFVHFFVRKDRDLHSGPADKVDGYREHRGEPDMKFEDAVGHVVDGVLQEGWTL